jgi:hypothetical protein
MRLLLLLNYGIYKEPQGWECDSVLEYQPTMHGPWVNLQHTHTQKNALKLHCHLWELL